MFLPRVALLPLSLFLSLQASGAPTLGQASAILRGLPIVFEANEGRWDAGVKFAARTGDSRLFLTARGASLSFAVVALIDGASTLYGLVLWGAGRTLPLATGLTIPREGIGLVLPAQLAALVLTFVPERLTLRMLSELRLIWSA